LSGTGDRQSRKNQHRYVPSMLAVPGMVSTCKFDLLIYHCRHHDEAAPYGRGWPGGPRSRQAESEEPRTAWWEFLAPALLGIAWCLLLHTTGMHNRALLYIPEHGHVHIWLWHSSPRKKIGQRKNAGRTTARPYHAVGNGVCQLMIAYFFSIFFCRPNGANPKGEWVEVPNLVWYVVQQSSAFALSHQWSSRALR